MIDPKLFHTEIEDLVEKLGCSYMDALITYQTNKVIEAETVSALVKKSPLLKAKLYDEQSKLKTVKIDPNKLRFD